MLYFALWALDQGKHGKQQVQAACRRLVVSTWALVILGCSGSPTLTLDLDFCSSSSDHGYTFEGQIDYCSSKRPANNSRDLCHTAVFNSFSGAGVKKRKRENKRQICHRAGFGLSCFVSVPSLHLHKKLLLVPLSRGDSISATRSTPPICTAYLSLHLGLLRLLPPSSCPARLVSLCSSSRFALFLVRCPTSRNATLDRPLT